MNWKQGPTGKSGATGPRGPAGKDGADGQDGKTPSKQEIVQIVLAVMEAQPDRFRGPAGNDGQDGAPFDLDGLSDDDLQKITLEVLRRLPPMGFNSIDPSTGQPKRSEAYLGDDVDLKFLSNRPYKPES